MSTWKKKSHILFQFSGNIYTRQVFLHWSSVPEWDTWCYSLGRVSSDWRCCCWLQPDAWWSDWSSVWVLQEIRYSLYEFTALAFSNSGNRLMKGHPLLIKLSWPVKSPFVSFGLGLGLGLGLDDHTIQTTDTPGFKPFRKLMKVNYLVLVVSLLNWHFKCQPLSVQ